MTTDGDHSILSSGRRFYAHGGLLSVRAEESDALFYGHDGRVTEFEYGDGGQVTRVERDEIADHMIDRWQKWKTAASQLV